jgi:hypothetical protein
MAWQDEALALSFAKVCVLCSKQHWDPGKQFKKMLNALYLSKF